MPSNSCHIQRCSFELVSHHFSSLVESGNDKVALMPLLQEASSKRDVHGGPQLKKVAAVRAARRIVFDHSMVDHEQDVLSNIATCTSSI